MGNKRVKMLIKLYDKEWYEERIPQNWETGLIVPIFKKRRQEGWPYCRGITLLNIVSKTYEGMLEAKLTQELEPQLEQSQCDFRQVRSIQDNRIFTIKQITEKVGITNVMYQGFLDLEKEFGPYITINYCRKELDIYKKKNLNENDTRTNEHVQQ